MRVLAAGGLGTLGATFSVAAGRAGAHVIVADRLLESDAPAPDGRSGPASRAAAEPPAERADGRTWSGPGAAARVAALVERFHEEGVPEPEIRDLDVTVMDHAVALLAELDADGPLDVVVDFAGVHHEPFDLALDEPANMASAWTRVMSVNLTGAFNLTVAAARVMVPRRDGQIIHLCSNGSRASLYGSYAYNASKHGVEGIVRTAAAQLAPLGVRVNGIAPGTVITDLNRGLSFHADGSPKPRAKSILAHTPTKRFATADGVARTLLAMCVPQPHATGNVIFCDDGYNVEGHSWPEGNEALYGGADSLDRLYRELDARYPRRER